MQLELWLHPLWINLWCMGRWSVLEAGLWQSALNLEGWALRAWDVLASYLSFVNILGSRVSGYDDTSSYHSPANAADSPATSAEPSAAPGSPPAAAGPHASTGNCPLPLASREIQHPRLHSEPLFPGRHLCPLQGGVGGAGHTSSCIIPCICIPGREGPCWTDLGLGLERTRWTEIRAVIGLGKNKVF